MEKRYQVFISSTFEDLQEERKEVMQALLELDCIPSGMELFPASNEDQWSLIKRIIDDCDYYLLIIGGRYGSINSDGISYTQMEFEYALEINKPIISFLPKNPEQIISGKCEKSESGKKSLEKFKKIAQKKMVKYWSSPQDLGSVVSRSMIQLIKNFPAIGWVRSDSISDEKSTREILLLQKEIEELRNQLDIVSTQPPKGTEHFSQREDEIEIHFSFDGYGRQSEGYECESSFHLTWSEIFAYLAPSFIYECNENRFAALINNLIAKNKDKLLADKEFSDILKAGNFKIERADFDMIKVQLKALGLITLSKKKRSIKDNTNYWTLTPYGDHYMTQLIAIKNE